jgi:hypothetical protein
MRQIEKEPSRCTIRVSIVDMIALGIRTQGAGKPQRPEFLYQVLPPDALTLFATLPRRKCAVSIPYHSNSGCGYVITKSLPTGRKGFVLVYALKANRRYEAVKAVFQDKSYDIEEFHEYASRWTRMHVGIMHRIPEKFFYFAPFREQWNVIRRDHGYMPVDPSYFSADLSAEILEKRQRIRASGVIVRIPVLACEEKGTGPSPFFAKVELTFDAHPDIQTRWTSFEEYVRIKVRESAPPNRIAEKFPEWLNRLKEESGFVSWVFRSGKLFGSRKEWWGDRNRRFAEHEGIDFAEGRNSGGKLIPIPEGTPVRAIEDGEIAAVLNDFLGKTVLVRHPQIVNRQGSILYTQYSHILPVDASASAVSKGQVLGRVGRMTQSKAPMHFHFAVAWVPQILPASELTLSHLHPAYTPITLINLNRLLEEVRTGI